jgi:Tfp pilus assembly protein PilO
MKIENRQQFLVVLTVAAAALYIGVNYILTPLGDWWSARSKQITTLRNQVKDGTYLIGHEASIRGHWSDMLSNSLPSDTSLAEQQVLRSIDDWSGSTGVEVTSLMPQWKADSTNYLTLTCHVETSGDIASLTRFIFDLEKGPMPLRLDSMELGVHDTSGQQMTLSMDVNGLALVQNQTK